MALAYTPDAPLGSACPTFQLPATDGKTYSLADFENEKAFLVMFICNHCPYVQAVENRLIQLGKEFESKSLGILAINANDTAKVPEDSFENMKLRAQSKGYPFPYALDESQSVAKTFGAACTPDFFLYDQSRKLVYRGRLDDSWKDETKVSTHELKNAIEAVLNNQEPTLDQKPSMGCSIKWKPGAIL